MSDGAEHDRVKRGVERLRRAATTVLEPPSSSKAQYPPDVISGARAILEQVTNVLCDAVMLVSLGPLSPANVLLTCDTAQIAECDYA